MSIGELSRRSGVSSDRLRAWERRYGLLRPGRTSGNYRRYSPADEARVKLMMRYLTQGVPAAEAAELAVSARFSVSPGGRAGPPASETDRALRDMSDALDRFDETSAQLALDRLLTTAALGSIVRDALLPYLRDLGERWARNHATVAQEHFATNFVHARLIAFARGWDRGLGPRTVLACAPQELHVIGLVAFGIALHQLGWRITYLGQTTPVLMAADAARTVGAELLVVSAAMPGRLEPHRAELAAAARTTRLAIAGAGATAELAHDVGAEHLRSDPITAAQVVGM
jgi:MerR family transcriptional regulator, light-induced transcriptional regulator